MKLLFTALAVLTVANVFPSQVAAQSTDSQGRPSVITGPRWAAPPSPDFPAIARRNGIDEGRVELSCRPVRDETLQECEIVSETPAGNGFGAAALTAALKARLEPQSVYGPQSRVFFAVVFRLAQDEAQPAAAATLPNSFDRPQSDADRLAARASTAPAAQSGVQAAAPASDPARVAAAEAMLRTTVAAMVAGRPNYGDMSDDLAAKVREQASAITPLIQSFGALKSLTHVGAENGAELFLVEFENQATQWIIAQNTQGKIIALLFRPAPSPG